MKQTITGAGRRNGHSIAPTNGFTTLSISLVLLVAIVFTACKRDIQQPMLESHATAQKSNDGNVVNDYMGLAPDTRWELLQARAATAKYRDAKNALKDGYQDIHVDVQHMGHHLMKMTLVDGVFDFRQPEILVYNDDFQLVAVEYAIPITEPRPEGFTGSADVWDRNTGFELWLLHAWVWEFNPLGVFNPTNPNVHID